VDTIQRCAPCSVVRLPCVGYQIRLREWEVWVYSVSSMTGPAYAATLPLLRFSYAPPVIADRTLIDTPAMMTILTGRLSLSQPSPRPGEVEPVEEEEDDEEPSPPPVVDEVVELGPPVAIGPTAMVVVDVGVPAPDWSQLSMMAAMSPPISSA
jgi:hypothetical protein